MNRQDIKFNSQNPNGYQALAQRAVELERQGIWDQAMHMWLAAGKAARKELNQAWAQVRAEYCLQAKHRLWRATGWAVAA